jgi:hypothetical protein
MSNAPTAPIPSGRYGAPVPAPNTPTECPRCGAPAISRDGVAKHTLHHRQEDVDRKRQKDLLDRLERFLDGIENTVDAETGKRLSLPAWIEQTDEALDGLSGTAVDSAELRAALEEVRRIGEALRNAPAAAPEPAAPQLVAWPEDEDVYAEADPDEIIPSSATHSFPGDEPRRVESDGLGGAVQEEPDEDALAGHPEDEEPIEWGRR